MTEYISISWVVRLGNWIFSPLIDFYFSRPKLYIYLDKVALKTIVPKIPNAIDEIAWRGELVIKNNSKHDSYNLVIDYPKGVVFDAVEKLPQHNNLSAKQEIRLKFSWLREYVNEPTGLQFRRGEIDTQYPLDKREFILILEYRNEKGKKFYSIFNKNEANLQNALFIFRPKIK